MPLKTALAWQGAMTDEVRLPLCALQPASREKLAATLKSFGFAAKP